MIAELYGKKKGCAMGLGGSMHLQDVSVGVMGSVPIVGSTIPIGVGMSFYSKYFLKNKNITVIFFGEGATEEGVFHECINFASLHNLPILFVCENNFYAQSTSITETLAGDICDRASAFGINTVQSNTRDWPRLFESMTYNDQGDPYLNIPDFSTKFTFFPKAISSNSSMILLICNCLSASLVRFNKSRPAS